MSVSGKTVTVRRAVLVSSLEQQTGNTNFSQHQSKFEEAPASFSGVPTGIQSESLNSKFAPAAKKISAFEKDYESHYALLDIHSFFKNLKISCVLQLRNIIPLSVDPEVIKKDLLSQLERIGKVLRCVHRQQNVWVEYERV